MIHPFYCRTLTDKEKLSFKQHMSDLYGARQIYKNVKLIERREKIEKLKNIIDGKNK